MNTTYQYEPLPVPAGWNPEEKRLIQRLTDIFDDIYLKWGRIGENELSKSVVGKILASVKKDELEVYLRFSENGLDIGRTGDLYYTRVTPESFDVMAGDEQVASFRDGLIIMGGWAIRKSADGGLVQSKWEG